MSCEHCGCDCEEEAEFDADELGLDPEEDVNRSLNERAARALLQRPMYPGEVVN